MTKDNAVNYITTGQMSAKGVLLRRQRRCGTPRADAIDHVTEAESRGWKRTMRDARYESRDTRCAMRDVTTQAAKSGHHAPPHRQIFATSALRNAIEKH